MRGEGACKGIFFPGLLIKCIKLLFTVLPQQEYSTDLHIQQEWGGFTFGKARQSTENKVTMLKTTLFFIYLGKAPKDTEALCETFFFFFKSLTTFKLGQSESSTDGTVAATRVMM